MEKKVLLIADDDEMNRKIISRFLKGTYEILEASDGQIAWDMLETKHIDALLLDIIMPHMDGLEVLEKMRKDKKYDQIGVLVATSTKEKTERTALSTGADDVVAKPYDPLVIEKRLSNILAMKEMHVHGALLKDQNYDALLMEHQKQQALEVAAISAKIQKYVEILNSNKDNFRLVAEITSEIDSEARKLNDIFTIGN